MSAYTLLDGNSADVLRTLPAESVQCCVTSPPYFGLRDYGHDGQIGLEATPDTYVANLVAVFREVRRVLRDDATLWLNIGDSYTRAPEKGGSGPGGKNQDRWGYGSAQGAKVGSSDGAVGRAERPGTRASVDGLKPKDLIGIPWMVAFALRADGWYLRADIIWHKPNPMPESVRDRPTKAHEYLFLLAKSERYFYDADAVREPTTSTMPSGNGFAGRQGGTRGLPMSGGNGSPDAWTPGGGFKNRRSVWTVTSKPFRGAHFATYPPDLIEPCILAGSRPGDIVLDPFSGAGTTGIVSVLNGRQYLGIELNPDYNAIAAERLGRATAQGELFAGKARHAS